MGRRALLAAAAAVVVAAVVGVVTEYATATSPAWLSADPWRPWLLFGLAVLLAVVLAMLAARQPAVARPGAVAPTLPRFAVTPASLRAPRVESVLGRTAELTDLASAIAQKPGKRPEQFVVVAGTGGMGKTTVVAHAVAEAQRGGHPVFWIRWRDVESLGAQLVHTATALGLPEHRVAAAQQSGDSLADLVWTHLESTPGWVLVVDNLDQPTSSGLREEQVANYRGWIRPSRAGLLVLTSRDQNPTTWGPAARLIRLGPLDDQTGAQVLFEQAPQAGTLPEAQALSARLGGLPLALRAAAAVLAEPTASLRSFVAYQQALADRIVSVLPELPTRPDATEPETARSLVGHTWELSLDQLDAEGVPLARPLLRLLSLFAEAPIPRLVLTAELLGQLTGTPVSTAALDGALAGLHRYCLLDTPDPARTYQIVTLALHPLVRETNALLLEKDADAQRWHDAVSTRLITLATDTTATGRSGWDTARLLAPHVMLLSGLRSDDLDEFRPARDILDNLADCLRDAGAHTLVLGLRQACLQAEEQVLGAERPNTLTSYSNLAEARRAVRAVHDRWWWPFRRTQRDDAD